MQCDEILAAVPKDLSRATIKVATYRLGTRAWAQVYTIILEHQYYFQVNKSTKLVWCQCVSASISKLKAHRLAPEISIFLYHSLLMLAACEKFLNTNILALNFAP